jgi:FkbM family methyltransferase
MIHKIITQFLNRSKSEKKLLLKDQFFTPANENLIRLANLAKKTRKSTFNATTIIDVGAFDGGSAKYFLKKFPECSVLAFEANPASYNIALQNCSDYHNICLHNTALSDKEGTLSFHITKNAVSSSVKNVSSIIPNDFENELEVVEIIQVPCKPLDFYTLHDEVLFIKIDTQGYELTVLEGAINTLRNTYFVLVEMHNNSHYENSAKYYQVDELLRNNGFVLVDMIITYRKQGIIITEYDAIYSNSKLNL